MTATGKIFPLALLALLAACSVTAEVTGPAIDVRGCYTYAASAGRNGLPVSGEIRISAQNGAVFAGSMVVRQVDRTGHLTEYPGIINGHVTQGSVDFSWDAGGGESRRHVGVLPGEGQWLDVATGTGGEFTTFKGCGA